MAVFTSGKSGGILAFSCGSIANTPAHLSKAFRQVVGPRKQCGFRLFCTDRDAQEAACQKGTWEEEVE
jgi:hypothetical protein